MKYTVLKSSCGKQDRGHLIQASAQGLSDYSEMSFFPFLIFWLVSETPGAGLTLAWFPFSFEFLSVK